jgi:regulation of enolase protein 1 (concanavalin A-like superfamily)
MSATKSLNKFYSGMLTFMLVLVLGIQSSDALAAADWAELSGKQQELLAPLKNDWGNMTNAQRERWLKVGRKYENEPVERQAVMRERVSTWSKLSAKDKAAARENYKALKEKRQGERNSSWNSYQSLDPKQRDEFKANKSNKQSFN